MSGDIIGDKYELIQQIGEGGMGSVFVARHRLLTKKLVAIKFLLPEFTRSESFTQRFFLEAHTASGIGHRGIVSVHDAGRTDRGELYIVMDLLRGESLKTMLGTGPLSPAEVVEYALQILSALVAVHQAGIVHRDLKPENIFVNRDSDGAEQLKILDFGVSKVTQGPGGPELTKTGSIFGTPYYMSPEQVREVKDVDHRADIWSVGIILFEMLCGRTPFFRGATGEIMAQITRDPVPKLELLCPSLPKQLVTAIHVSLEKEPSLRYQQAEEFRRAILSCQAHVQEMNEPVSLIRREAEPAEIGEQTDPLPEASVTTAAYPPNANIDGLLRGQASDREATWHEKTNQLHDQPTRLHVEEPGSSGTAMLGSERPSHMDIDTLAATETGVSRNRPTPSARTIVVALMLIVIAGLVVGLGFSAVVMIWNREPSPVHDISVSATVQPSEPVDPILPVSPPEVQDHTKALTSPGDPREGDGDVVGATVADDELTYELAKEPPLDDSRMGHDKVPGRVRNGNSRAEGVSDETVGGHVSDSQKGRMLSREEVQEGLSSLSPSVRQCLRKVNPPMKRVVVRVRIDGSGSASYQGATPTPPGPVGFCLRETIPTGTFPTTAGKAITVTYQFTIKAVGSSPRSLPSVSGRTPDVAEENPYGP